MKLSVFSVAVCAYFCNYVYMCTKKEFKMCFYSCTITIRVLFSHSTIHNCMVKIILCHNLKYFDVIKTLGFRWAYFKTSKLFKCIMKCLYRVQHSCVILENRWLILDTKIEFSTFSMHHRWAAITDVRSWPSIVTVVFPNFSSTGCGNFSIHEQGSTSQFLFICLVDCHHSKG